jgi:hypothetical protein
VSRHVWKLKHQGNQQQLHHCLMCGTKRLRTYYREGFPVTKYTLPDGCVVTGLAPKCGEAHASVETG